MLERQIEEYIKRKFDGQKIWYIKFNSASMRGFPDRIVFAPEGKVYFAELKAPNKHPNKLQEMIHKSLYENFGHKVWVIDNLRKADEFVNEVLSAQLPKKSNRKNNKHTEMRNVP